MTDKTIITREQSLLIDVIKDKLMTFGYGVTEFHTKDIEELLNIIEKLTRTTKDTREIKLYSECCNAMIYFDDQSFEACSNCDDRI